MDKTDFSTYIIDGDKFTAFRKREQIRFDFDGFQLADQAKRAKLNQLLGAVIGGADWIEQKSKGSAHEWKAQHGLRLNPMWRYLPDWNFGIKLVGNAYVIPPFMIASDRDTLPMQKLGRLEAVLRYLVGR